MTDLSCTIRPAVESDIGTLISLLHILFSIEENFVFNEDVQNNGLRMMLDYDRGCVLVAELESRVVGMCTGQLIISTAEGGPALLVEDVVVHEQFRKLDIGRKLIEAIALWGEGKGASRLQLLADRNNTSALNFYETLGWQTTQLICLRKVKP